MIPTSNNQAAADVATLLVQRTLAAEEIALFRNQLNWWIQEAGRIEDELERAGLVVERMTEPGDIKVRIAN